MTETDFPLVTIVTPSYNHGAFIEDAILSIRNQTYPNIEHIIVDGASTDNTVEILKRYEETYSMRWISEPDSGQTEAVNKAFKLARGDVIGWINSDDALFDIRTISTVVSYFSTHHDADVIYGDAVMTDENNWIRHVIKHFDFDCGLLKKLCYITEPATFFRRAVIDRFELDTRFKIAMDYDFWLRVAREHRFVYLREILAVDRQHAHRKIAAQRDDMFKESRSISQRYGKEYMAFTWGDKLRFFYLPHLMLMLNIFNLIRRVKQQQFYATNLKMDHSAAFALRQALLRD